MTLRTPTILFGLALAAASPAAAWAYGGIGCADLPEYARATGALQGMTGACDMSVEQARRIIAAQDGGAASGEQPAAPARHIRHRRHRHAPRS